MRHTTFLIILLLGISLLGYGQRGSKNTQAKADTISDTNNDKAQIEKLVKQVLKWHDINGIYTGFETNYNPKDSMAIGMNLDTLKNELNELRKSDLFDKEFIDNYNKIVLKIDEKIKKSKDYAWQNGDMPSFAGADPWCDCQNIPYENPWDKIVFKFLSIDKENADLTWTWGNSIWSKDFNYRVKAKKTNGKWRISYLQGFDINNY